MIGYNCGLVYCGSKVSFGEYVLKVISCGCFIVCQIEFVCCVLICYVKCGGKIWICVFFDKFVIKKFFEVCMGKGKGGVEYWVVQIQLGKVLYEIEGVFEELVCEVFVLVVVKLFFVIFFVKWMVM